MQFNDTSGGQGLIQDCEDLTGLGATGISGNTALLKQFTRYINNWYHKVVTMILETSDDWDFDDSNKSDYPVATTPLVASQRDYTFPASLKILKVKRVDVTWDNVNWVQAQPADSKAMEFGLGSATTEDYNFNKGTPRYDLKGNSVWLYPLATAAEVTAAAKLRIEFFREPTEFTTASTTTEPGFDEPFHRILSMGASFDYAVTYQKPMKNDLFVQLQDMEKRLKTYYSNKNGRRLQITPRRTNYE